MALVDQVARVNVHGTKASGSQPSRDQRGAQLSNQRVVDLVVEHVPGRVRERWRQSQPIVEAARAGEQGRGFAVVADEVQRLAERSSAATKQIGALVKAIQTDTNEAVISMEQTTVEVVDGARQAQDAGVALEEIEGVSASLAELIRNISNAAQQQASTAGHVSEKMKVIQRITSQTAQSTEATANSIGDLAGMANEMRVSVEGFKLPTG